MVYIDEAKDELEKLRYYESFLSNVMVHNIHAASPQTDFEYAIQALYLRATYLATTIVKLDEPWDVQTSWSIARTLFELHMEARYLVKNQGMAVMFHEYKHLARFYAWKRIADFAERHPQHAERYKQEIENFKDEGKLSRSSELMDLYYDSAKRLPNSWTNKQISELARELSDEMNGYFEHYYSSEYVVASWFIHGGGIILGGVSREMIVKNWLRSLRLAGNDLKNCVEVAANALNLFDADPTLRSRLDMVTLHIPKGKN